MTKPNRNDSRTGPSVGFGSVTLIVICLVGLFVGGICASMLANPPRYEWASIFKDGIATIYEERDPNAVYASHTGYIDTTGKYIWEPQAGRRTW